MNLVALLFLAASFCSCRTLPNRWDAYNRRELYSPESALDSCEATRQMRMKPQIEPTPAPKPQFAEYRGSSSPLLDRNFGGEAALFWHHLQSRRSTGPLVATG
jgi:hypothetical protein